MSTDAAPGPADLTLPDYGGGSIVNAAATLLQAFGVAAPAAPLRPDLLPAADLSGDGGVVLLVVDALGVAQLRTALSAGVVPRLAALVDAAPRGLQEITSVFPSTTTAALNSLATACPPAEHGILGHILWLEEHAALVNMLTLCPIGADRPVDEEALRRVPTVYQRLARAGIGSTLITDAAYEGTAFTNLLQAGAELAGYSGLSQIPYQLQVALEAAAGQRRFYSLYWPLIDTLSHLHAPDHEASPSLACRAEMEFIDLMVGKVADLCRRHGCDLVLLADHGQTALQPEAAVPVAPWQAQLTGLPGGGRRVLHLTSPRPQDLLQDEALRAVTSSLVSADEAVAAGWFGGPCDGLRSRLGDVIAVAGPGRQFLVDYGRGVHTQRGSHAGLTAQEMRVPLLVVPAP